MNHFLSFRFLSFFFISLLFLVSPGYLKAQLDNEFWFSAPELTQSIGEGAPRDRPIQLVLSTLEKPAEVRILLPADLSFTPIVVNMAANATQIINLTPFVERLETKPHNTVLNNGILITATNSISAYYEIRSTNNTEIITLKGANANGRLFYTPFQTHWDNAVNLGSLIYNPTTYASFDMVATDDSTFITVTPRKPLVGHPANVPFTIMLNRGQVYSCRAIDRFGANRPVGTRIESTKDIAVVIKDDMLQFAPPAAGADIASDQIVPVDYTGTDYVVVRGGLNGNNDRVYILATEDNTVVRLNGIATPVATLNEGEQFELVMADPSYFIKATKKVYAWHISGIQDQVAGAIIPTLACTGTNQIGFSRSNSATFVLNIITKESAKNSFTLNGNSSLIPGSAFQPIQGSNGWVFARITLSTAQVPSGSNLLIKNPSNELFHVGLSNYAIGVGSNYGYFSNFSRLNLGTNKQLCIGDTAVLDAGPAKTSYVWSTGATTRFIETTEPGKYWVNTLSGSQCPKTDTVTVRFYSPTFNIGPDDTMCIGETRLISPPNTFTYSWQDGSSGQTFLATQPGIYWAQAADFQGCTTRDSLQIFEAPRPQTPVVSGGDTVCFGQSVNLAMNDISGVTYEWKTPDNQIISGKNLTISTSTFPAGQYKGFVKVGTCTSLPDSAMIEIIDMPQVNLGKDTVFCGISGSVVLDPLRHQPGFSYEWNTGSTDSSITVTSNGTYFVKVVNSEGCESSDTISVNFQGPTGPSTFTGDDIWCQGQNAIFGVQPENGFIYQWSGPNGFSFSGAQVVLNQAQIQQSGLYSMTPVLNGCQGPVSTRTITINPSPQISLGQDIVTCLASDIVLDPIPHGEGLTYLWSNSSTDSSLSVNQTGTYFVSVSDGNCTSKDTLSIQFGVGPSQVDFLGQSTFCQNTLASFGVVEMVGETYAWSGPNGFSVTGSSIQIPQIQLNQGGSYTVIPEKDGCQGTPFVRQITVLPAPIANLGPDTSLCSGGQLTLDPTPSGGEEMFYVWNTGAADSTLVINQTGVFDVLVTDGTCSSRDTIEVFPGQGPGPVSISGTLSLCSGQDLNLTVSAEPGVTYSWSGPSGFSSSGSGITIQAAQPGQSGNYKVITTKSGCIGAPDSVNVVVSPQPVVNLGPDLIICQGGAAMLQAGPSGFNYVWNTGSSDSSILVTTSGQYFVSVSSSNPECKSSDTINVTFGAPPATVIFTGSNAFCAGATATFGVQPEPGISYQWVGPGGFSTTGPNISIPNFSAASAGMYKVIPSLGACLGDTATIQISFSQGPLLNLGPDQEVCGFSPVTLNAANGQTGLTFLWNTGSTDSTLTINQTGQYSVTVSTPGCTKSDTIDLVFKPLPLPVTIEGDQLHCAGDTLQLSLQGTQSGVVYNWTGPNAFSFQGTSVEIPNVSILQSGLYTVKPQLDGCDGPETFLNVTVNPSPSANLGPDLEACLGTSFTLDPVPSSLGLSFLWNTGSTDTAIVVSQSGIYYVKVMNLLNCSRTDSITVNLSPVPVNLQFSGDSLFCTGQSGTLQVSAVGNLVATWSGPNGFSFTGTNLVFSNVSPTQSGYYVVVPRIGSCFGSRDSVMVRISDKPTVDLGADKSFCDQSSYLLSVENPQNFGVIWSTQATSNSILVGVSGTYFVTVNTGACSSSDTISLTFNSTPSVPVPLSSLVSVCAGNNALLQVQEQNEVEFEWTGPNGFSATGDSVLLTNIADGNQIFTVVANKNGCKSESIEIQLKGKPNPGLQVIAPTQICKGNLAQVQATYPTGASILWSDLSNQPVASFGPGKHWATVNLDGCLASDTFAILNSGPIADFVTGPDSLPIVYSKVQFLDRSTPGLNPLTYWEWKLGYSQIQTTQNAEFTYAFEGPVLIQLIVKDAVGCADTVKRTIEIQPVTTWSIPTVFTPNGDGANDSFEIIELDKYPGSSLSIFDRWGKEQFTSANYQNDWKGADLVEGIYYYVVKRSDGQSFNGYVLLKR